MYGIVLLQCAITYVLITGIDGGASEICEGWRRAAHKDARGGAELGTRSGGPGLR